MKKLELIRLLAEKESLSLLQARSIVDLFFDSIADALSSGDRVESEG